MSQDKKYKTLEEEIHLLQKKGEHASLSIEDILHTLPGKGRSLILILLSIPFCQPLQIPGFSLPFGLAIAFIGLRMSFGKQVWLPKRILQKKIPSSSLKKITTKALHIVKKMNRWIHPRLSWICQMHIVNGLAIALLGIGLALPLPIPLSNLIAAWAIFFMAFGLLEDDGVLVLIGYIILLCTVAFLTFTAFSIKEIFSRFS